MYDILDKEHLKENTVQLDNIKNKIINSDSIDIIKLLPQNCIDLVVTSPPYDDLRDYKNEIVWNFSKFEELSKELFRIMKPGGIVVWVVGDRTKNGNKSLTSFRQAIHFQNIGFNMYDVIIYEKSGTGPPHPNRYFNAFEYMFILTKGKIKTVNLLRDKKNKWAGHETYSEITRREKDGTLTKKSKKVINEFGIRTNIWRYINGKGFAAEEKIAHKHPAIFPEKLVEDHIRTWSNEGDLVLDIFGGSGTTIKAAEKLNRKWIYIDKVKEYCEIASKRMEEAFSKSNK
jgi:site-specific DNA-methyltransferase (adenine-specific)